jgi:sigma-B regulation protein RsbU (phosphoserine phosphatase)
MLESRSLSRTNTSPGVVHLVLQMVLVLFQVLALGVLAISLLQALRWMQTPFMGVLVNPSLQISRVGSAGVTPWLSAGSELAYPRQILAVNGQSVSNGQDLASVLSGYPAGAQVQVLAAAAGETPLNIPVTLQPFPVIDQILYFWVPFVLAIIFLACGIWLFGIRRRDRAARSFSMMAATMAVVLAGSFDLLSTHSLLPAWLVCLAFAGGSFISLGVLFPQEVWLIQRHAWLRGLGYVAGGMLALLGILGTLNPMLLPLGIATWQLLFMFSGVGILFYILMMVYRWRASTSPVVREQARLLLAGSALSFGPAGLVLLLSALPMGSARVVFSPYLYLPLILFPLITAYAIQRYRVPDVDFLMSRGMAYVLLTILTVVGYALLVTGASLLLGRLIPADNPLFVGGLVFALALLLNPVRARLQKLVDRLFHRSEEPYQHYLQAFSRALSESSSLAQMLNLLRQVLDEALSPAILHLFVYQSLLGQYVAADDSTGKPSSELRFPGDSPLVELLASRSRIPLYLRSGETVPLALYGDRARLALMGSEIFIPLPGRNRLVGWIALGQRLSGTPYAREELNFLESLGDQVALALERAQVVTDLERRVEEMDVLARIAQGINITLNFDDILELVFAQTNRLLPTRDFAITLRDTETDTNYHAFYIEDD